MGYSATTWFGISQKLVIVHPHLCVAWSGGLIYAHSLIRSLREFIGERSTIPYDDLRAFLIAYPIQEWGGLDVIIYSWHGSGWGWFSNLKPFDLGEFTNVRVAGSGSSHFISQIEPLSALSAVGEILPYQAVAMRAIGYAALASIGQLLSRAGIEDGWGGAFEVVTFYDQHFQKQDRILWLRWWFERKDERIVVHLDPAIMFQYCVGSDTYFWIDEGLQENPARLHQVSPPHGAVQPMFGVPEKVMPALVVCFVKTTDGAGFFCDGYKT